MSLKKFTWSACASPFWASVFKFCLYIITYSLGLGPVASLCHFWGVIAERVGEGWSPC